MKTKSQRKEYLERVRKLKVRVDESKEKDTLEDEIIRRVEKRK